MNLNIETDFLKKNCFQWPSVEHRLFHFHALALLPCLPSFLMGVPMSDAVVPFPFEGCKTKMLYIPVAKSASYCIFRLQNQHHTVYSGCKTNIILYIPITKPTSYCIFRLQNQHHTVYSDCKTNIILYNPVAKPTSYCIFRMQNQHHTL